MPRLGIYLLLLLTTQDPHASERGAMVMGFDQTKTAHHFHLYDDGGAIDIAVNNATDTNDLTAIRSHLPHVAMMFGEGNFDAPMLVHDATDVPGISTLIARKNKMHYKYVETSRGGRVDIVSTDSAAVAALHDFLRYQIQEHHTGDSGIATQRP